MRPSQGRLRLWPVLALLLLASVTGGCLEPYRARVDPDVLERAPVEWNVTVGKLQKDGWFGARSIETRYRFDPDDGPPYPAVLQVFSVRELDRATRGELRTRTERLIEEAVVQYGIVLDRAKDQGGERELGSGVSTLWFTREGRTQTSSGLFQQEATVRVLGEVGYDGRSSTSIVVVALSQVSELQCAPLVCTTAREVRDLRTWINIAGDEEGSIGGATSQNGLVDHLRTHG